MSEDLTAQRVELERLLGGYTWSQVLSSAVRLGVVEAVADGVGAPDEIAARLGLDARAVGRVLRGLAALGLVNAGDGRFEPRPALSLLQQGEPGSLYDFAIMENINYRAFAEFGTSLRLGASAFEAALGKPLFRYLRDDPEAAAAFNNAMLALSQVVVDSFVDSFPLEGAPRVVDVGGGLGHLGAALARANPEPDIVVFDLPRLESAATQFLGGCVGGERCRFEGGDFFKEVPRGGDIYLLKWVLHDWGDDRCVRILQNCQAALPPKGRLVIIERPVPETIDANPADEPAIRFDVIMLGLDGTEGARERTIREYEELLDAAHLARRAMVPLTDGFAAMVASPAG